MTREFFPKVRLSIDGDKCDKCASRRVPLCTEACPRAAIYPDANSVYAWSECDRAMGRGECSKCVDACPHEAISVRDVPSAKVMKRPIVYFETPGIQNTAYVVDAIAERVAEGDIRAVVVASCSGSSALSLARALRLDSVKIISITLPERVREKFGFAAISDPVARKLAELDVVCREQCLADPALAARGCCSFPVEADFYDWQVGRQYKITNAEKVLNETLIHVGGMGLKTAVECMFSVCVDGDIAPGDIVISAAGSGWGLDTATVIKAATPQQCFGPKPSERLEIREILAMPVRKQRWG